jgi:hypothetical protein
MTRRPPRLPRAFFEADDGRGDWTIREHARRPISAAEVDRRPLEFEADRRGTWSILLQVLLALGVLAYVDIVATITWLVITGGRLRHMLKAANQTKQQQDAIAKGMLANITSHERTVTIRAPGDVSIRPDMNLVLSGTGTAFDQSYVISDIEHNWSQHQGYVMTVRVRNMSEGREVVQEK